MLKLNLQEEILSKLQGRLRSNKQLLILSLSNSAQISLWNAHEKLWQEDLLVQHENIDVGTEIDYDKLEANLRDVLLQHDVEEGANMLILLPDALLQKEQLTLPQLTEKQLIKAVAWEAEQLFGSAKGSYSWCYEVLDGEVEEGQQLVHLWKLKNTQQESLLNMAQKLLLKLQGICVAPKVEMQAEALERGLKLQVANLDVEGNEQLENLQLSEAELQAEKAARQWFAGAKIVQFPAPSKNINWMRYGQGVMRFLPRIACGAALLAVLTAGGTWGACYLVRADVRDVQEELARYAEWQQRRVESTQLEKRLAQLKQQAAKRDGNLSVAQELEAWGKLGADGVCLTLLECTTNSKVPQMLLTAQGQAADTQALENLVEKLHKSGRYAEVTLLESQQQERVLAFTLKLASKQVGKTTGKGEEHEREN